MNFVFESLNWMLENPSGLYGIEFQQEHHGDYQKYYLGDTQTITKLKLDELQCCHSHCFWSLPQKALSAQLATYITCIHINLCKGGFSFL